MEQEMRLPTIGRRMGGETTLPTTNIAPEDRPSQMETSIPTRH